MKSYLLFLGLGLHFTAGCHLFQPQGAPNCGPVLVPGFPYTLFFMVFPLSPTFHHDFPIAGPQGRAPPNWPLLPYLFPPVDT